MPTHRQHGELPGDGFDTGGQRIRRSPFGRVLAAEQSGGGEHRKAFARTRDTPVGRRSGDAPYCGNDAAPQSQGRFCRRFQP